MSPPETPLERAARHVRDGHVRVVGQEAAVRRLERGGPSEALADARDALAQMLDFRELAGERLRQEIAAEKRGD